MSRVTKVSDVRTTTTCTTPNAVHLTKISISTVSSLKINQTLSKRPGALPNNFGRLVAIAPPPAGPAAG